VGLRGTFLKREFMPTTTNVGKDVGKKRTSHSASGNVS
jgi:hypothetical protein